MSVVCILVEVSVTVSEKAIYRNVGVKTIKMSFSSRAGRNSRQKSKVDVVSSAQITVSETTQVPNIFHFWNGDEYAGQFALLKDKQKLVMEGRGVYATCDGQTYEGIWQDDCLKQDCKITFPDKSVFSGSLDDMVMQGNGKYTFKENVQVEGQFVSNVLVGETHLRDPHQRLWRGAVNAEDAFVGFHPLHAFWQSVLQLPSKAPHLFYGEAAEDFHNIWEGIY